jgi:hypothetical protein
MLGYVVNIEVKRTGCLTSSSGIHCEIISRAACYTAKGSIICIKRWIDWAIGNACLSRRVSKSINRGAPWAIYRANVVSCISKCILTLGT